MSNKHRARSQSLDAIRKKAQAAGDAKVDENAGILMQPQVAPAPKNPVSDSNDDLLGEIFLPGGSVSPRSKASSGVEFFSRRVSSPMSNKSEGEGFAFERSEAGSPISHFSEAVTSVPEHPEAVNASVPVDPEAVSASVPANPKVLDRMQALQKRSLQVTAKILRMKANVLARRAPGKGN